MMLPARNIPGEDPSRNGLEGAAGTPAEAPSPAGTGNAADAGTAEAAHVVAVEADVVEPDAGPVDADVVEPDADLVEADVVEPDADLVEADVVEPDADLVEADVVEPDAGPVGAGTPPPAAGSPAQAGSPARPGSPVNAGPSVEAAAGHQWSEILTTFVDDPRGSVEEASVMVNEAVDALIATTRGRQASLAASWQDQAADTEQLRRALQDYRAFWGSVTQLPEPA
jgi:hypothetical protein